MRTARRSKEQLKKTSASRADVFKFVEQFHGRHYWTIDGPMDTDVDEIMCFCIFARNGDNMGICLVQTWCRGGWDIYVTTPGGTADETRRAIFNMAAAPQLLHATVQLLGEIDSEIEQRKHGGNDEDWAALEALSNSGHDIVRLAAAGSRRVVPPIADSTDYKTLFFKARDLLNNNSAAWDDEEESVKEEHADLIAETDAFLKAANGYATDEEKSDQYWESNTGYTAEGKPIGGVEP